MLKRFDFQEEPIIKINLWKIQFYLWKAGKAILKTILKIMTIIVKATTWIYKKFSKFCKLRIKGFWIVLLLVLFIVVSVIVTIKVFSIQKQKDQEYNKLKNIKNEQIDNLLKEKERKDKEIQELKKKITYQEQRNQIVATGWEKVKVLPKNVKSVIAKYSEIYNVNQPLIECIVANESEGRYNAIGDNGDAVGVGQFHLATFLGFRKQMGLSQKDLRTDIEASIQAMCWSISQGGIGNWTARFKCV